MTSKEILEAALELIRDPARFCVIRSAENAAGIATAPGSPAAVRFCVLGACARVAGDNRSEMWDARGVLRGALFSLTGSTVLGIAEYNDRGHSYAVELLERAIELA